MDTPPDGAPLDPQGIIADLRHQLAERTAERDEAQAREIAVAEVLGVINASPGELTPVFDAMLEKAMRLCGAAYGSLELYDGEFFRAVATIGFSEKFADLVRQGYRAVESPDTRGLIEGAPFSHILDLAATDAAMTRSAVELDDHRTLLCVPLRRKGRLLGMIAAARKQVRPFSDKEIALLQNFAAQAVIAMENARLLTETREALEQQTATAEVLGVINASPGDLQPVFQAILERAHTICGAELGALVIHDGNQFRAVATHRYPAEYEALVRQPFGGEAGSAYGRLAEGERYVHIPDLLAVTPPPLENPIRRAALDIAGIRTVLLVPLRKEKSFLGYISAQRREVLPFSDKEIALIENFAAQAVIAMENARLITETREALEQQTATAEVLGVINASPGDLAPVFDAILEKAHLLCGAAKGALAINEGGRIRAVATRGLSEAFASLICQPHERTPGGPDDQLLSGKDLLHIPDAGALPFATPRAVAELEGARTVLFVALRKDRELLGYITAYRQEVRPFSDKQIALLQNFAAQAVIAMENARLITETREALERQTATAEVLGVINSSPGDLEPVFDAMLEKAMHLCDAAFGILWRFDEASARAVALHNVPAQGREALASPQRLTPDTFLGRALHDRSIVHVTDVAEGEGYRNGVPLAVVAVDVCGVRSLLIAPLIKDADVVGALAVYRQQVQPFSDKEIALLENFAAQAVIAMESARLLSELRARTADLQESLEYQTVTSDVLKVISRSTFDLQPVLDTLVETAAHLCGAEDAGMSLREGEGFRYRASYCSDCEFYRFLQQHTFVPGRDSMVGRVALEGKVVHIPDIVADPEYKLTESITLGKIRTLLGVPLIRDGVVVGTFNLWRHRVEPFAERQIELVRTFADQAVIAMENERLLGELRTRTEEVAELNRGLEARVAEQVNELGRVGRLKRFLAPQLAELIVSQGDEKILESHRREIVVVFCDLRGYTAFTETAEPEEVLDFLREYHGVLGPLVSQFEGTLDQFSGDGIMVFFNDPVPIPDAAERAVRMAVAMREAAASLIADWRERGRELGFGVGIAQGYATLGQIGFSERSGYTAIGTVCNVAARLCAEARDGQILLSQRVNVALKGSVATEQLGALVLKGLTQPVVAYNVPLAAGQPALRVIEGGPGNA